jgi:hypothetical protein
MVIVAAFLMMALRTDLEILEIKRCLVKVKAKQTDEHKR